MKTQAILQHQDRRWKEFGPGEILYFLNHLDPRPDSQDFEIEASLILEDDEPDEDLIVDGPEARLLLRGNFPQVNDWAGFEESVLEFDPGLFVEEQAATTRIEVPEVDFWSFGNGEPITTYAQQCWDSRISFGKMDRLSLEVTYHVEAFHPTDETREAYASFLRESWNRGETPDDRVFAESGQKKGWNLDFRGTAVPSLFHCIVPINAPRPVNYARHLAATRLGFSRPTAGRVVGSRDWETETFEPEDGICDKGRIVSLRA
tara:strand:- start:4137 stop:4919 length:783 start_codon:yes stop_codon:yes gene_type:complete